MKVGDKVKVLLEHGSDCQSNGCRMTHCMFFNHIGIIIGIDGNRVHVNKFNKLGAVNCSAFRPSDLELFSINWRERIQSYAESKKV